MANYKTVPNQKVVKMEKQQCDQKNYYARINLEAMECAAQELKAGAFKLWVYFAKNQDGYEFALSSKDVLDTFGIKKDQYDSAIKELTDKGYLVEDSKNHYTFKEIPVVGKTHNSVVGKNHNELQEKPTRNITDITYNTTKGTGKVTVFKF